MSRFQKVTDKTVFRVSMLMLPLDQLIQKLWELSKDHQYIHTTVLGDDDVFISKVPLPRPDRLKIQPGDGSVYEYIQKLELEGFDVRVFN